MSIGVEAVAQEDLPEELGAEAERAIPIQSKRDDAAIADGETDPFDWMDLRDVSLRFSSLLNADEAVLEASEATLVLSYPMEMAAKRLIRPSNGKAFTRGELVKLIDETYREIYRLEAGSQSSPTPPVDERVGLVNRPRSDGSFGIWGHDLDDLGIERIGVYVIDGHVWLRPSMVS